MEKRILRFLVIIGLIFLLGWLIYESAAIIIYILLAMVVALVGRPIFNLFGRISIRGRQLPNALKAGLTLVVIFGLAGGLLAVFVPMVFVEAQLLTTIDIEQTKLALSPALNWYNNTFAGLSVSGDAGVSQNELINYLFESISPTRISDFFNSLVGVLGNFMIAVFSIAFISFFLLKDKGLLAKLGLRLIPSSKENRMNTIMRNTRQTLSRYFLGLLIQVVLISVCIFIGLRIVGIENALLIAVFTGIVNLVPYLGPWIGASFGIFIMVANNIDAGFAEVIQPKLIGLLVAFAVVQMIDNYIFQPTIFSNSINAHPLEIFIVILVAGSLGGVAGMIAAIPVYSFLRIVFVEMNREFLWLDRIKRR